MKYTLSLVLLSLLLSVSNAQNPYFPPADASNTWDTLSPSSLNWCPDSIETLYNFLEEEQTKSFIVLKEGKIVLEKYFGTFQPDSLWFWFSAGKSLRSMLVGIAQEEGLLDIMDPVSDYLGTGWTSLPPDKEDAITIWHQLTMTSGLDESEFFCTDPECLTYIADAGTRWVYHNSPYSLTRQVIENASGQTLNQFTNTRIRNKIGMGPSFWLGVGDNTFFLSKARDMARFGLLVLAEGNWNGTQVLGDATYFQQMLHTSQELNPSYGYLWWLNGKDAYISPGTSVSFAGPMAPDAPADVVLAAGAQGQYISISKEQDLIIVRQGSSTDDDLAAINLHNEIWKRINHLPCVPTSTSSALVLEERLYPNPVTNGLLYMDGFEGGQMKLFNSNGQLVFSGTAGHSLPVHQYVPGLYLVRIQLNGRWFSQKIVIK
jgi:CubicO group peptidase (beta-lactamase class C family)